MRVHFEKFLDCSLKLAASSRVVDAVDAVVVLDVTRHVLHHVTPVVQVEGHHFVTEVLLQFVLSCPVESVVGGGDCDDELSGNGKKDLINNGN